MPKVLSAITIAISLANCIVATQLIQLQLNTSFSLTRTLIAAGCLAAAAHGFWSTYARFKEESCSRG